jgi:precorrin-6x reductase
VAAKEGYDVLLCVANNYGKEVISPHKGLYVSVGKLDEADMQHPMKSYNWKAVIDATHPYASTVTSNIRTASERLGLEYVRVRRNIDELFDLAEDKKVVSLPDMDALVEYLDKSDERVFIASGSNAAEKYAQIKDACERLTIRIIPSEEAIKK